MITSIVAIAAAVGLAALLGWLLHRHSGAIRETAANPGPAGDSAAPELHVLGDLLTGLPSGGPTVVHFSAPWCGPCARVRRVVDEVCGELGGVSHLEIDIDANQTAAQQFSVMSLPTTLIFDANGRQRYRTIGVPKPGDLRAALEPLLA